MIQREVAHFAAHADARVVEHIVQASVGAHGFFHQVGDVIRSRDIQQRGRSPTVVRGDGGHHRLGTFVVDVGNHRDRSPAGQLLAERAADAGRAASHDGDFGCGRLSIRYYKAGRLA